MGKAVLSNRIYLTKTNDLFTHCLKELKYVIPSKRPKAPPEIINDIVLVSEHVFSIPIARTDLIPEDYEIIDKRVLVPANFPELNFPLREDQLEVYEQVEDNCLINAKPGWGKTFTALHIAKKLGQKTLIVTHNTILRDQWIGEVNKLLGANKAGIIGTSRFETNYPVVVANIQTLTKHMHKYAQMFGTIITDECHRVPSTTFKNIVDKSYARYKIGLSATIGRKDGKHIIIPDYFSNTVYTPKTDPAMKPKIFVIYTDISLNTKLHHWAKKITDLCQNPEYINLVKEIVDIKSNLDNRKVLCVADRTEFLTLCASLVANSRVVTGTNMLQQEREGVHQEIINGEANSLFGTTSIYKEGVNIPPLSCLVLGSPLNNMWLLEQLIGRVTRPYPGKPTPEIIDLVFTDNTSKKQFAERLNYYISKGYEIIEIRDD